MKKDEILQEAYERFKESVSAESDQRDVSTHNMRFENGEQWSDAEKAERKGRPCVTISKVSGTIKQVVGEARQNTPAVKVRAVDQGGDVKIAQIYTGLIRDIENRSKAKIVYDTAFSCQVRGGYGYWRVLTDYESGDSFDQEIRIKRIVNPQSVYFDQSAIEFDYSDAQYAFIAETMRRDKFQELYPDAEPTEWDRSTGEEMSDWFTDDAVRVAEYFYKVPKKRHLYEMYDGKVIEVEKPKHTKEPFEVEPGIFQSVNYVIGKGMEEALPYKRTRTVDSHVVMWAKLGGGQVLDGPTEWPGKYIPIVIVSGEEVWIDGKRILRSAIYHAIDAQKLYNWARSNAIETLAMAPKQPFMLTPEEIEGHESQWAIAHKNPQPYLLYNEAGLGRPQPSVPAMPNNAATKEAMHASDDIKATTGIYDASLGNKSNETSGKAISERRLQGNISTYVFTDNLIRAIEYTGRILVDLIPKIYDTERVVRLLNEDGSEAWQAINVTSPETGDVVAVDLSIGRYDVVVDTGPAYMTRRMEAADGLMMLAQTAPQFAPILIPRIAKSLDWPDADVVGDEMKQMAQPQPQPPDPKTMMDVEKKKMEVEGKKLDNIKKTQDIEAAKQDESVKMANIAQAVVLDTLRQIGVMK